MSVTQVMEQYQSILEEEVHDIAYETGAVKRKGKLDVVTLVQMMIFGFWQDPDIRLSGLAQIGGRREVNVTGSAITQRFTPRMCQYVSGNHAASGRKCDWRVRKLIFRC